MATRQPGKLGAGPRTHLGQITHTLDGFLTGKQTGNVYSSVSIPRGLQGLELHACVEYPARHSVTVVMSQLSLWRREATKANAPREQV